MKKTLRTALLAATAFTLPSLAAAHGTDDAVVVSIKPIHSLVAGVMRGVGSPHLIVKGGGSPHAYSLKPSDAEALEHAKVVFWIGHEMETFLEGSIKTLSSKAKVVALEDAHDLVKLKIREGVTFDTHDHSAHGDDHDDHDHEKKAKAEHDHDHDHDDKKEAKAEHDHDHDHDHEKKAKAEHDHDHDHDDKKEAKAGHDHDHGDRKDEAKGGHDDHAHGEIDMHLWLDPKNAKAMVHEIEEALAKADPANAAKYKANAEALEGKLDALTAEISKTIAPVKNRPFVVFHDAYPYFENRFGVQAAGSITVSPEKLPGAKRLKEIQAKVKDLGATCVFSEPQFEPKLVRVVTEGTKARAGVLDPLGADLKDGPELYFTLLRNMAKSMKACLSPSS